MDILLEKECAGLPVPALQHFCVSRSFPWALHATTTLDNTYLEQKKQEEEKVWLWQTGLSYTVTYSSNSEKCSNPFWLCSHILRKSRLRLGQTLKIYREGWESLFLTLLTRLGAQRAVTT